MRPAGDRQRDAVGEPAEAMQKDRPRDLRQCLLDQGPAPPDRREAGIVERALAEQTRMKPNLGEDAHITGGRARGEARVALQGYLAADSKHHFFVSGAEEAVEAKGEEA